MAISWIIIQSIFPTYKIVYFYTNQDHPMERHLPKTGQDFGRVIDVPGKWLVWVGLLHLTVSSYVTTFRSFSVHPHLLFLWLCPTLGCWTCTRGAFWQWQFCVNDVPEWSINNAPFKLTRCSCSFRFTYGQWMTSEALSHDSDSVTRMGLSTKMTNDKMTRGHDCQHWSKKNCHEEQARADGKSIALNLQGK